MLTPSDVTHLYTCALLCAPPVVIYTGTLDSRRVWVLLPPQTARKSARRQAVDVDHPAIRESKSIPGATLPRFTRWASSGVTCTVSNRKEGLGHSKAKKNRF